MRTRKESNKILTDWVTALSDPCISEEVRTRCDRSAREDYENETSRSFWNEAVARTLGGLTTYIPQEDVWRSGGQAPAAYSWRTRFAEERMMPEDEESDDIDLLPSPDEKVCKLFETIFVAGEKLSARDIERNRPDWLTLVKTIQCLLALARYHDPFADPRVVLWRESWDPKVELV